MNPIIQFFSSHVILLIGFSFLMGSIPVAMLVSRFYKVDLRQVGSGNFGSTNVYRALGLRVAGLVFVFDFMKGALPTWLSLSHEYPVIHILVGGMAVLGHTISPFAGFKGGKGAATGLGVLATLCYEPFLILSIMAAGLIMTTRTVSIATIICVIACPLLIAWWHYPSAYVMGTGLVSLVILIRHIPNIRRLIQGSENKL